MKKRLVIFIIGLLLIFAGCNKMETGSIKSPEEGTKEGESLMSQSTELFPAYEQVNGEKQWGYVNMNGKFVIAAQFSFAEAFQDNGLAIVERDNKKYLIKKDGHFLINMPSDDIKAFSEGLAVISNTDANGKTTDEIIDENGQTAFKANCDYASRFCEGKMVVIEDNDLRTYVDKTGKKIIDVQYIEANSFYHGKALVKKTNGAYAQIDATGKEMHTFNDADAINEYTHMIDLGESMYQFVTPGEKGGSTYGVINSETDRIVYMQTGEGSIGPFQDGHATVSKPTEQGVKYGLIDKEGKSVISPIYSSLTYLGDGLLAAVKETTMENYFAREYEKNALIDVTGKVLTDALYYSPAWFGDGMISVTDGKKTFLIRKDGSVAIPELVLEGVGTLEKRKGAAYGKLEEGDVICDMKGKSIWIAPKTTKLGNNLKVDSVCQRSDRFTFMNYPIVLGMKDIAVQDKINQNMKTQWSKPTFEKNTDTENNEKDIATISQTFDAARRGDLLEIRIRNDFYIIGVPHGNYRTTVAYFDLKTGDQYCLKNMMKSGFEPVLNQKLKSKIAVSELKNMISPDDMNTLDENQSFTLSDKGLTIFYQCNVIAPYVAGEPEILISWDEIEPIVNKQSDFWKAFKGGSIF